MKIKTKGIIEQVSFSVENNHGYLRIKFPYGYEKIQGKIKKGDEVKVKIKVK